MLDTPGPDGHNSRTATAVVISLRFWSPESE